MFLEAVHPALMGFKIVNINCRLHRLDIISLVRFVLEFDVAFGHSKFGVCQLVIGAMAMKICQHSLLVFILASRSQYPEDC